MALPTLNLRATSDIETPASTHSALGQASHLRVILPGLYKPRELFLSNPFRLALANSRALKLHHAAEEIGMEIKE